MEEKLAFDIAKMATDKYFEIHKEQLSNLKFEDFVKYYTFSFDKALNAVNTKIAEIDIKKLTR